MTPKMTKPTVVPLTTGLLPAARVLTAHRPARSSAAARESVDAQVEPGGGEQREPGHHQRSARSRPERPAPPTSRPPRAARARRPPCATRSARRTSPTRSEPNASSRATVRGARWCVKKSTLTSPFDQVAIGEERRRRECRAHLQQLDVARHRRGEKLAPGDRHDRHRDERDEHEAAGDRELARQREQQPPAAPESRPAERRRRRPA